MTKRIKTRVRCPKCKRKDGVTVLEINVLKNIQTLKIMEGFLCENCAETFIHIEQLSNFQRGKLHGPRKRG